MATVQRLVVIEINQPAGLVGLGEVEDGIWALRDSVPFRGQHREAHAQGCHCQLGSGYRMGQEVEVVTLADVVKPAPPPDPAPEQCG